MSRNCFREILALGSSPAQPVARGSRLPAFMGMPSQDGAKLDMVRILIVGCGSVGSSVALHCARLQIGELYLVDRGAVKRESLLTHAFAQPECVGKPKASLVAHLCRKISPTTRVWAFDGDVQHIPLSAFEATDLVVLATDNLSAELDVAQRCLAWCKPLVQASVHGETLVAQVRTFRNDSAGAACPVCAFGEEEREALGNEVVFSCQPPEAGGSSPEWRSAPTMSVSCLCNLAADLAMVSILRHVLGLGAPLTDVLLEYCGYAHRLVQTPLKRNPDCLCRHEPLEVAAPPRPRLEDCSLDELGVAAGAVSDQPLTYTIGDELVFAESASCRRGHRQPVHRFLALQTTAGRCLLCGEILQPDQFFSHRAAPKRALQPVMTQPLREIGASQVTWALVGSGQRRVAFLNKTNGGIQ